MLKVFFFLLIKEHVHDFFGFEDISFESVATIDCRLNGLLLLSTLDDLFFDGAFGNQTVNRDRLGLPDSVSSILSLSIYGRIPIIIIEDDSIGSS